MNEESDSDKVCMTRRRTIKGVLGTAATITATPVLTGTAAAHFKPELEFEVKSSINPHSKGVIPVEVLQTDEFDPTSENVNYRFGSSSVVDNGNGARPDHEGHAAKANDGRNNLVLHFPTEETGLEGDDTVGKLVWERGEKGAHHGLSGTESIDIVSRQHH